MKALTSRCDKYEAPSQFKYIIQETGKRMNKPNS